MPALQDENRRLQNQVAELHANSAAPAYAAPPSQTPSTTRTTWSGCQMTEPTRDNVGALEFSVFLFEVVDAL
jgi:hypothetical protein